jgi:hypothetical protein
VVPEGRERPAIDERDQQEVSVVGAESTVQVAKSRNGREVRCVLDRGEVMSALADLKNELEETA